MLRIWKHIRKHPKDPPPVTLHDMRMATALQTKARLERERLRHELQIFDERMVQLLRESEERQE